jgi:hypothetical protein
MPQVDKYPIRGNFIYGNCPNIKNTGTPRAKIQ